VALRIDFDAGRAVGPGKIKLLELIEMHGSISEPGRQNGVDVLAGLVARRPAAELSRSARSTPTKAADSRRQR
jgi:hypothetical protein